MMASVKQNTAQTFRLNLLTLNGSCKKKVQLKKYINIKNESLNIRKTGSFLSINMIKLGIYLAVYTKGGFKLAVSNNSHTVNIFTHFNKVMKYIVDVLECCYDTSINSIELNVTQVSININPPGFHDVILTLPILTNIGKIEKNTLIIESKRFIFKHMVDLYEFESGQSSFFFYVCNKCTNKQVCCIKMYNNFKIVLFLKDLKKHYLIYEMFEFSKWLKKCCIKLKHE
jgi:hypothetical protein